MTEIQAMPWSQVSGVEGLDIISRYLAGDKSSEQGFAAIIQAAIDGQYDAHLAGEPDTGVHVTTSCHLMVLAIMNRLNETQASDFYKNDPERYVRLNCLIQRMLGLQRLTLGWPVYGFGAEVLGQTMIYTEAQAPGSDPGEPLLNFDNWQQLPDFDPAHLIACIVRDNLIHMARLSGIEPVAHLPAPYSLAAEILGQEHLINALTDRPDFVFEFLDLIVARVLKPWCDDLVATVPDVWLELSDASGSPMFIGPDNFLKYTVEPVRRLIDENSWGDRVFVANYRGDIPAGAKTRGRRKRRGATGESASGEGVSDMSFEKLLAAKKICCPQYLTRLEADVMSIEHYVEAAIRLEMPLYLGIGAVRLDRNSLTDLKLSCSELHVSAHDAAQQILKVSQALEDSGKPRSAFSWPGDVYVEDTNAETHVDLLQAVLDGVRQANS